jgi:membrane fusion protein, multidrug efflux system
MSKPRIFSLLGIGLAVLIGLLVHRHSTHHPTSDDASIDAEVVHIAPNVSGRLVELRVEENSKVKKGDLLFRLDPESYALVVTQAEANLEIALAALDTRRRMMASEVLNAKAAADQQTRAKTNYELTQRSTERMRPLAGKAYIPEQEFDQAQTTQKDAATSLEQAKIQRKVAETSIGNDAGALAAVKAAQAALAIAQKALRDTEVYAPQDGRIVGLAIRAGEMVAPTQSLFTLIATDEWHAIANFRESELPHVQVDDCATVYSMIDRTQPIRGKVDGIGWGVMDTDRINVPRSAPFVEKSLNWVRVAQRFPVRIKLEGPPESLMRLGASAVVQINQGALCTD